AAKLGIDARRVDAATEVAELSRSLAKVVAGRDRLLDLFVAGRIAREEFDAREPALKAEADRLQRAVEAAQARVAAGQAKADEHAAVVAYCRLIARGLDRLDAAGKQTLVRKAVLRIVVHPDGELHWQFRSPLGPDGPAPQPPAGAGPSHRLLD